MRDHRPIAGPGAIRVAAVLAALALAVWLPAATACVPTKDPRFGPRGQRQGLLGVQATSTAATSTAPGGSAPPTSAPGEDKGGSAGGGTAGGTGGSGTSGSAAPYGAGRQIGEQAGAAHTGETIWALIVASEPTEKAARARLADAKAALGEFETYFVVDESSHYGGMPPGWWVVFEPYRQGSHARAQANDAKGWLSSRGLDSYAKQVTVRCKDRFPLAEDMLPED